MASEPRNAAPLELRGLTKRYGADGPLAVDELNLSVSAGEICVLIGPSGCGKSTALRMINRLVEPTAGQILIDGDDSRAVPAAQLRRNIGYVIQQVGLLPHHTIAANVATVPRLLGWDRRRIDTRVTQMLELVGLEPGSYARRYPTELSGGEQQRVGLARALAAEPQLILMDEPFSALDPITRERLQGDFLELRRTVASTVVFVTHDIDEAVRMGDRIAIMRDGRIVQIATPADLLANPADAFVTAFVGADRALKALAIRTVRELPLQPLDGSTAPEVTLDMTQREALSRMLDSGAVQAVVRGDHGPHGVIRLSDMVDAGRRRIVGGDG